MVILTLFSMGNHSYDFWSLMVQCLVVITILFTGISLRIQAKSLQDQNKTTNRHIKNYTIQHAQYFCDNNLKDFKIADKKAKNPELINHYKEIVLISGFNKSKSYAKRTSFNNLLKSTKQIIIQRMNLKLYITIALSLLHWCRYFEIGNIDKKLMAKQIGLKYIELIDNHKSIFNQLNVTHQFDLGYTVYDDMKHYVVK